MRAMSNSPLRIGILGAARIAPLAMVRPARSVEGVEIHGIAARSPERARAFAEKHGVRRVYDSYRALLDDPEIDAIYNPLPNSLHAEWTIRALEAKKHVLCEKPLATNADEAAQMVRASERAGRVMMEAFHYRFHPLIERVLQIVHSDELGEVRRIQTFMCIPLPLLRDIRYRYELGGGATMDVGCYAIHMLRTVAGCEPRVVSAEAKLASPTVDRAMRAEMSFPDGRSGSIECSLLSKQLLKMGIHVQGTRGELKVINATVPQLYHRLSVRTSDGKRVEKCPGEATYTYQLKAFARAVREGIEPVVTHADSIANMTVIDAVYRAAGLPLRGGPTSVMPSDMPAGKRAHPERPRV